MTERRIAILIDSSRFAQGQGLEDLRCPENDVDGIDAILKSEVYGGFTETHVLKNLPHHEVLLTVNRVLRSAGRDDLVLIYYSGHGKLNPAGKLHLATANTSVDALEATSVPLDTIRSYVDITASNKVVLMLDCCFSGAAGPAFARSGVDDQLQLASGGRGTYIVTASTAIKVALEKEADEYGVLTKHIIGGIRSGDADLNRDGQVDMDELYRYVHDRVLDEGFQEPMKWNLNVRGELVIAGTGRKPREDRLTQLREKLLGLAAEGLLPDPVLSRALEVGAMDASKLAGPLEDYDSLLDQLIEGAVRVGDFIERWYGVEGLSGPEAPRREEGPAAASRPPVVAEEEDVAVSAASSKVSAPWKVAISRPLQMWKLAIPIAVVLFAAIAITVFLSRAGAPADESAPVVPGQEPTTGGAPAAPPATETKPQSLAPGPAQGTLQATGPGGGVVLALAMSQNFESDRTMFAGTASQGLFRSNDGGGTWQQVGFSDASVLAISVAPIIKNGRTIFATVADGIGEQGRVYVSTDEGRSWDLAGEGLEASEILALAVSPSFDTDGKVYAGTDKGLYVSFSGAAWQQDQGHPTSRIHDVETTPALFTGTDTGVYRSRDEGTVWELSGLGNSEVVNIAISPGFDRDATVFAGTQSDGLFRSSDGGNTWQPIGSSEGLSGEVRSLAISPNFETDGTLLVGIPWSGVFRSTDRGDTWRWLGFGDDVTAVALSPTFDRDDTVFAAVSAALFHSDKRGDAWKQLVAGPGRADVRSLTFSPLFALDRTVFAGTAGSGAFVSPGRGYELGADERSAEQPYSGRRSGTGPKPG